MAGIVEVKSGDIADEVAVPEAERCVFGVFDRSRSDLAVVRDQNFAFMKSDNSTGVTKGEFVENFDKLEERHRENDHFGVVEGAEKFLELGERGDVESVGLLDDI